MKYTSYDHTPPQRAKALLLRGCHQVTPYRAGWEDTRYARQYLNPFTPGSAAWQDYDAGNQDARKAVSL